MRTQGGYILGKGRVRARSKYPNTIERGDHKSVLKKIAILFLHSTIQLLET